MKPEFYSLSSRVSASTFHNAIKKHRAQTPISHGTESRIRLINIGDKDHATAIARDIYQGKQTRFDLVSYKDMKQHIPLRSKFYAGCHILCHTNSRKPADWLVCNYTLSGHCPFKSALKKYDTVLGTSTLRNHTRTHEGENKKTTDKGVAKVGSVIKGKIIDAAVYAIVEGLLPLNFAYNKHGMLVFATSLVVAGRSVPMATEVDVRDLLLSNNAVREGVSRLARKQQELFRSNELQAVLDCGGGVTSDGLKQDTTGTKYYDFVVHYFRLGKPNILTRERHCKLVAKVIFLQQHHGTESAVALKETFDQALMARVGIELDVFMRNFTFVADCAFTMPCIVGASSSSSKVPFTEKWLGCISHQLNTVMKHVIDDACSKKSVIAADLSRVKTVVRVFKHGNWNDLLPSGFVLIQEIETRFGTTYSVVERFLKSASKVGIIIAQKNSGAAAQAFDGLLRNDDVSGTASFPALEAITTAFSPLRHMQTCLETSSQPTMHLLLPMLETAKRQLRNLSSGMAQGANFCVPHQLTQDLCASVLAQLRKVEIHDLWVAGCVLHRRMRGLSFLSEGNQRNGLKSMAFVLIRRILKSTSSAIDNTEDLPSIVLDAKSNARLHPNSLGEKHFRLEDAFDIPDYSSSDADSLSKYLARSYPRSIMQSFQSGMDIVNFWISQAQIYPDLSKVALRIYATPVSSASSERNFSAVNRIVSSDRSRLKPQIYSRSSILNESSQDSEGPIELDSDSNDESSRE